MPPLVADIDLSMDDRFLYVSCWGTGDFHQYDVSDPMKPGLTGKVRIGGIVSKATSGCQGKAAPGRTADGGDQPGGGSARSLNQLESIRSSITRVSTAGW